MHSSETHMHSCTYRCFKKMLCNQLMEVQSGHVCQIIKGVWLSSPVVIICVWFRKQSLGSEGQIRSSATCSVTILFYYCYDTKGVTHSDMNHIISRRTQQAMSLLTVHLSSYVVHFAALLYTVLKHFYGKFILALLCFFYTSTFHADTSQMFSKDWVLSYHSAQHESWKSKGLKE